MGNSGNRGSTLRKLLYYISCKNCKNCKKKNYDESSSNEYIQLRTEGDGSNYLSHISLDVDMDILNIDAIKIKSSNIIKENKCIIDEYYDQQENLGEGSYGIVIKVKQKLTQEIRAMKVINKSHIIFGVKESEILNEIKILKNLDHMNILKIFEFFKDENWYYIITEYRTKYYCITIYCSFYCPSFVYFLLQRNIVRNGIPNPENQFLFKY